MTQFLIAIIAAAGLLWLFHVYNRKLKNSVKHEPLQPAAPIPFIAAETKDKPQIKEQELDFSAINRAYRIADMHFCRGDFEQAEKWLIKVLALHEAHTEALNRLGIIYIHQNNLRKAELLYRKLLSITQKEPSYYCNYGRCLYNQGKSAEAVEAYENAVKLDCTKPARFASMGQIHYEQKSFSRALECFEKALALDPQNMEFLTIISELSRLLDDKDRLHRTLKKINEIDPYNEAANNKSAELKESKAPTQKDSARTAE